MKSTLARICVHTTEQNLYSEQSCVVVRWESLWLLDIAVGISVVDLERSVVGWPEQGKVGTSYSVYNYQY